MPSTSNPPWRATGSQLRDAVAELLLGAGCPGCDSPGWGVCPACRELVARPVYARPVHAPQITAPPTDELVVVACADYDGPAGRMLRALKDGGAWSVAGPCGAGLARAVTCFPLPAALVPIPSTPEAVRRRGFDHTAALARQTSRLSGQPVRRLLRRRRAVRDQTELGRAERQRNQRASMAARRRPGTEECTRVILVDDICTTGATVVAAAQALASSGWQVAGAVVVADTA